MRSSWSHQEAKQFGDDLLGLRVYTSRLLGREPSLVLHGGGNTSVKVTETNAFGEEEDILYVKGSGWDLSTIERAGFAPVRLSSLLKMAEMPSLSDEDMVKLQRAAMTNPFAPNPSVEAILHAIIPYRFVDHTHADAVVTLSNTPGGRQRLQKLYGPRVLIVPYVMPGFVLARDIYLRTKNGHWPDWDGLILMHHGVFTFADEARASYEKMIQLVTKAEQALDRSARVAIPRLKPRRVDGQTLAHLRHVVSKVRGAPVLVKLSSTTDQIYFSQQKNLRAISQRGPLTPDHIIRTKRTPVILDGDFEKAIHTYVRAYERYFRKHKTKGLTPLDPAPRWAVWPGVGTVAFGRTQKENTIIADIVRHTTRAILQAEKCGGWRTLSAKDLFAMEYWTLEQAKLKKQGQPPPFQGKITLVTGAASGIGRACVDKLVSAGAVVTALDINPEISRMFGPAVWGRRVDLTQTSTLKRAVEDSVSAFGGLDILVLNAGIFPPSEHLEALAEKTWEKSLAVNLTAHQRLLSLCIPFLKEGIDPSVVIIASKNVLAPGPGVAAYSVAKAGLTQLGRVAALELAPHGIRVNMLHPDAVFDTAIWTKEVLHKRAAHYGLTVDQYKRRNLLRQEVTSSDVADLVVALSSPLFAKTTGAQIPVDGGNERVI